MRGVLQGRLAWLVGLLLSGCATYHPKPLPTAPDLTRLSALTVPASRFGVPGLKPHAIHPGKGLDETAVMILAVYNNPDLKAARLRAGVARAQLLEAGLLPDPHVSGGLSYSSLHSGYSIGLREDLQALITRGAAQAAARAHARQVNLAILWREWQVAQRARELFIALRTDTELRKVLTNTCALLSGRYHEDDTALKRSLVTADRVSADLAALTTAETRLHRLQLQGNRSRHALDQLLGLKPGVDLHLIGRSQSRPLTAAQFQAAVAASPHRRPDLLALQAGYKSQEQQVRKAILAQFPSLSAGVEQARSAEEGIHTIGFTVDLTLPLFNRNRGRIAIQRATRALLRQTYQARLDQAVNQADQIWHAARIMSRQSRELDARLSILMKLARSARREFQKGNLNADTYIGMESRLQAARIQAIRLHSLLGKARAALDTLLGLPLDNQAAAH